ncbi:unnamed protein product, partial [Urochloa humidicola]
EGTLPQSTPLPFTLQRRPPPHSCVAASPSSLAACTDPAPHSLSDRAAAQLRWICGRALESATVRIPGDIRRLILVEVHARLRASSSRWWREVLRLRPPGRTRNSRCTSRCSSGASLRSGGSMSFCHSVARLQGLPAARVADGSGSVEAEMRCVCLS